MQIMGIKLPGHYATFYTSNQPGDEVKEHTHTYPHSCTVISGSVRAVCNGKEKVLGVGQSAIFPKDLPHSITPLSVGTIFVNATAELSPGEEAQFLQL
jgi:quercetin dioxygenase-like cupin family protein